MKKLHIISLLIALAPPAFTQQTPIHISQTAIYDFIDELSLLNIIDVNNVVKPYPDKFIYNSLKKAEKQQSTLNNRQQKELAFYLQEYSYFQKEATGSTSKTKMGQLLHKYHLSVLPPRFRYRDSLFFATARLIWGTRYYKNDKGLNFHRWGGGSFNAHIGEHFAAYGSLRDNNITELFSKKEYLTDFPGGNFKGRKKGGGDYSEIRGGLTYSWTWGSIGMVKDHVEWGTNYHGANILSSRAPSYAQIKFHLKPVKWFEFNYLHGWLVSNVIDSTRSYVTADGVRRDVMHPKYIAANMFTLTPFRGIHLSVGNSIIYSDLNPHPAYFIPFLFYKSVDHWLNSTDGVGTNVGQNSQMFANVSILRLKHFHFYGSLFLDELKFDRIRNPDLHNFWNYKAGIKYADGLIPNLALTAEYTRTSPITYEHIVSTTTFESNGYNLGHYLRSNSDELYFALTYKPLPRLLIRAEYIHARHGKSFQYTSGQTAVMHPFMEEVKWENTIYNLLLRYEFAYNSFLTASYQYNNATGEDVKLFTPEFYQGQNHTLSFGFNFGF